MNQAIQIYDGVKYHEQSESLQLDAVVNGELIKCFIGPIRQRAAVQFYEVNKFDIEDYCSEVLEHEQWDENGELFIAIDNIPIPK